MRVDAGMGEIACHASKIVRADIDVGLHDCCDGDGSLDAEGHPSPAYGEGEMVPRAWPVEIVLLFFATFGDLSARQYRELRVEILAIEGVAVGKVMTDGSNGLRWMDGGEVGEGDSHVC